MYYLIVMVTLFLHIWADFYKQGWLAQSKCKNWWVEQENYTNLYKNDYWGILVAHSIHWSFCIMLPSLIYGIVYAQNLTFFCFLSFIIFIINVIVHSIVDNQKANKNNTNLLQDQSIHLIQIIVTVLALWGVI